jgi:hypothetical protein
MTNEPSSERRSDKAWIIEAVCINCDKRFNSTRAVSMHLKARHDVSFGTPNITSLSGAATYSIATSK